MLKPAITLKATVPIILDRDFAAQIRNALQTVVDDHHQAMEKGLSHDHYMRLVGAIEGLRQAAQIVDGIRKKNEREDS